ncbi:MAG: HD domain-containing protein [Candidatus Pedobacter colombiensis]|uniref:HD domain-containing protein n=1 Tax=Candidatus Pedobacter colombiensis TaxID=3121371 RepID=A0AAJ5WDC1_9SPHI|nr:HD domain-containing protein [Pedobacter sp.]WEK21521.1 MAG: HD domain-containing protein [Pedobacter sp.]
MIQLNDVLYGNVELPTIFADLLNTEALKRLGGVHQSGAIFLVNPDLSHSRLEHSIGVSLLIKILGGSELEQIAGLLHDISHTAFSHVGDYVFENGEENYHEQIYAEVLLNSEVPAILMKHGYHIDQILNGNFPILEQPLPHLCADRLDYTLRDALHGGLITRYSARQFLQHIKLQNGLIVVTDEGQADWINDTFKRLNDDLFNLPLYVYANQELAAIIRDFLRSGFLKETDLFKDDTFLLNKIRSTNAGYEAIKAIKLHKGYTTFLRKGSALKIKPRRLKALLV